jgi:hypothetical protein
MRVDRFRLESDKNLGGGAYDRSASKTRLSLKPSFSLSSYNKRERRSRPSIYYGGGARAYLLFYKRRKARSRLNSFLAYRFRPFCRDRKGHTRKTSGYILSRYITSVRLRSRLSTNFANKARYA